MKTEKPEADPLDAVFERLFNGPGFEAAPPGFAGKVLEKLGQAAPSAVYTPLIGWKTKLLIGLGLFAMAITAWIYRGTDSQHVFSGLMQALVAKLPAFSLLDLSWLAVAAACWALFLTDRLLGKTFRGAGH